MNRLLEYLPQYYHDILDFRELTETETPEVLSVEQAMERLLQDQFVLTASEQAIKRREKMLGIQADPKAETLDFRRKRLINRYSTKPPFTVRYLQQRLDFLVGAGMVIISVDPQSFTLTVTASMENASVFKEVEHTIRVVKPVNLVYQQQTGLEDELLLSEHISKRNVTWNYRLDWGWLLGSKAFAELGAEVVIK
ncbi:YmfQ family protein [Paenibacillus motobuensis]|uniref:putative phage tail protein n=1 Tax=Paenibacillus TaxID=44249 RepID=UPI00203BFF92|nr:MULTISPECIES: putative phage tail protein [Paenibacillus]MCM3040737.1 YmfQ family protein [Paenibacillus lutimineralis]MCM3647841.1 YmfQ family protein [Paenibacillus motobuensis]